MLIFEWFVKEYFEESDILVFMGDDCNLGRYM